MSALLNYKLFLPENDTSKQQVPLFILHGLLGAMDNWRTQARRLSSSRPVMTLDLRNHGNSPHVKGMSYRDMVDDVLHVAQHEKFKRFDLLGHSMGGKVAMQLALANEERVRRLIVVDIAPKTYPLWHQKTLQTLMNVPLQDIQSRQEINDYLSTGIEDRTERAFMLKNLKRSTASKDPIDKHLNDSLDKNHKPIYEWRCNIPEISRNYLKIAGFSKISRQYSGRTLFIKGEYSSYIESSDYPLIHSLFPKAKIIRINGSGHLPHFEQADAFFERVNPFLGAA